MIQSAIETPLEIVALGPAGRAIELSVVMPCLNEARTLPVCIAKALDFFERNGVRGEVIVADNGSTDGSQTIAARLGARVVNAPEKGYGMALQAGIRAARGEYVVMGDSDDSYDFGRLEPFVEGLHNGADLVMGNRYRGGIEPGAMPAMHRYLGNPVLTGMAKIFFKAPVGDVYCGLRGFRKDAFERMEMQSPGMEFALEMVVKATMLKMRIAEAPTTLSPDGRGRAPHLRTWRDGRRSLKFYLLCAPKWLFLYPGLLLIAAGMLLGGAIWAGPLRVGRVELDVHTLAFCMSFVLIGFQAVLFSVFAKTLAMSLRLLPYDPRWAAFVRKAHPEYALLFGAALGSLGIALALNALLFWQSEGFGNLDPFQTMRAVIPSALFLTLGFETAMAGIYFSLLKAQLRERP